MRTVERPTRRSHARAVVLDPLRIGAGVVVLLVLGLAGCGGDGEGKGRAELRIERCVNRLAEAADDNIGATARVEDLRRYVEATYCNRFEQRDWIYDDGALRIGAHKWLERAGSGACQTAAAGRSPNGIPCDELGPRQTTRVIDCALLHYTRRAEVQDYLATFASQNQIECDDGTPLEELGVP